MKEILYLPMAADVGGGSHELDWCDYYPLPYPLVAWNLHGRNAMSLWSWAAVVGLDQGVCHKGQVSMPVTVSVCAYMFAV